MLLLMMISVKPAIVDNFRLPLYLKAVGWTASVLMAAASLGFLPSTLRQSLRH